jgi:hypothetical protein
MRTLLYLEDSDYSFCFISLTNIESTTLKQNDDPKARHCSGVEKLLHLILLTVLLDNHALTLKNYTAKLIKKNLVTCLP